MSATIETKNFWEERLEKFKLSGLTRSKYCKANNINYDRFGYWVKKSNTNQSSFIPVEIKPIESNNNTILCLLDVRGHTLHIYDLSAVSFLLERTG